MTFLQLRRSIEPQAKPGGGGPQVVFHVHLSHRCKKPRCQIGSEIKAVAVILRYSIMKKPFRTPGMGFNTAQFYNLNHGSLIRNPEI